MCQEPSQSINQFLSQMYGVWDQLSLSEPAWNDATDAQKFTTYRDQQRLILLLMALTTDFEHHRASLLHHSPLPTLEQAISELLSEETRLGTLKTQHQHLDTVPVTSQSTRRSTILSSDGDGCRYCHNPDHNLVQCPSNPYKQSNYFGNSLARGGQNKPHNQFKPLSTSRTVAAATEGSSSDMPSPPEHYVPSISMHDLESILKQVSSHSSTPSPTAKSTSSSMPVIHTADGSHMHVGHVGHVSTTNVSLPGSYLIPALTLNLISVGQLCELGLTVIFSPSGCQVQDPHTG
ncbi:hypothetical protein RHGRI_016128 [Rhododendron griersonianum]|uniref:Uncharacterized protein n=1 Tax=Rhododendron griersonianum TaxID=479676 RepID=A0AAV6JQ58_9ERIC|nr:hypothetical protein RHGRI_016128 [Rhododendron griersonianum]